MHIIPAIDIIDGKCVRLTQGDYSSKKEYRSDPLEVAKEFEAAGIKRLHLVDLDGALKKKIVNLSVLEKITTNTSLHVDFGGGVQSDQDIRDAFDAGAKQVTGGSIAVKQPDMFEAWLVMFGAEKIILGADVRDNMIAVSGWQEKSTQQIFPFLENYLQKGIQYAICTDVSKDGALKGPAFELYGELMTAFPQLRLIASGGVSSIEDVEMLAKMNLYGVIIGKAIYENAITLKELQPFLDKTAQ